MVGELVVFDRHGTVLDTEIPEDAGPATLLVSPLTDALKRVVGERVVESVDRGDLWILDAFVVDRNLLDGLGDRSLSAEDLLETVSGAGYDWVVSSTSAP